MLKINTSDVSLKHFEHAAQDIGLHGDNDTLPFDIDNKFIKDKQKELAKMAFDFFCKIDKKSPSDARNQIEKLDLFSERLLVPSGPYGFRITTKIHPFWNIYLNGLGVAIAEKNESNRKDQAHSYRYVANGDGLFDRGKSWRAYREATLSDENLKKEGAVVVQTDISNFYEHIYHHRIENCIHDLFPNNPTVKIQVDRLLSKLASGRSFGIPVGGQCSRILAELLMTSIDQRLCEKSIIWHRYVDDFVLIAKSQEDAYNALSVLSHILADYGLSLNKSKTSILSAKHYADYTNTQLATTNDDSKTLREIDLYFDPYSDSPNEDYKALEEAVAKLDVQSLLKLESQKSQPDTFLVSQISRTLKFHSPDVAIQLCKTLLSPQTLHSFRASWSTIMRGVSNVRADDSNSIIFNDLDQMLDDIPKHSPHLLHAESSLLYYLRTIRFISTDSRAQFVLSTYENIDSKTVKRGCIDCWRMWKNRPQFIGLRNNWSNLSPEVQRIAWLSFAEFGDEGVKARSQVKELLQKTWSLGIEKNGAVSFADLYQKWANEGVENGI